MATRPAFFSGQFLDTRGGTAVVAASYLLDTFESGTTTPKTTYADEAQTTANPQPIVLDSSGRCSLFLGAGQYTLRLRSPAGAVIYTWDDVEGLPTALATPYLPLAGGTLTGAVVLAGNATANLNATPLQQVQSLIAASLGAAQASANAALPAGVIALWPKTTPPTNWLECNGQAVSRTTYAALFAAYGTQYGVGDGSTTFNLPDLRGEFVRGWDNGRGVDSGRTIGSAQDESLAAHTHDVTFGRATATGNVSAGGGGMTEFAANFPQDVTSDSGTDTGTETRPRNIALMMICKAS